MKKEEKKPMYMLCPRCELNYIQKKDKYCNVCKAEMGILDPSILIPDEEEAGVERLCPVCHINYIGDDEEICFLCQKERDEHEIREKEDEWKELASEDDDLPEELPVPLSGDEFNEDEDEDIEDDELPEEEDDFIFEDDIEDFDEDEEEEEEEDEEEEDF